MSRNLERSPTSVAKTNKRRDSDTPSASSFDLSDDGGYSAVEDITDSEDNDEEDVDAVEEENICTEAVVKPLPYPRPLFDQSDDYQDHHQNDYQDGYDGHQNEQQSIQHQDIVDILGQELNFEFNTSDANIDLDDFDDDASWAGIASDIDMNQTYDVYHDANAFAPNVAIERHVRFDVPSSDSDSTETEDDHADLFPDIFVSQNSLDPAFRREIENDVDDDSSGSATFWECSAHRDDDAESDADEVIRRLSNNETDTLPPLAQTINSEMDKDPTFGGIQSLDGYETDGDTTEEDTPEPPARRKMRRSSVAASDLTDSESEPVTNQRGQPRLGRFKLDRSDKKPIAVLNHLTRKMMIFTPHRRHQLDLSPEQFNFAWPLEDQSSPLFSNSANMMLSAMFSNNTFGDFINAQAMGPAEAFFPFQSENTAVECSSSSMEGDDDDAEKKLDISDFITWGDDASSGEEEGNADWQPSSTPLRPTTASSEIDVLSHLSSDTVGAFRRNQINQQLILSSQATPDSLAFSGPYNYMALKGLKSDRFDTAGIPLTPMRRHKRQKGDAVRSPLEAASSKRKVSDELGSEHKRQRSISDANILQT